MNFLKLIRYQNLLMIALMQFTFHYGFLKQNGIFTALNDWQYALLVLSTVLIAAAGYIINDIEDQEIDKINKPEKVIVGKHLTENTAYNLYFGLSIAGLLIGFYLSNLVYKNSFFGLFIIWAVLLYLYSTSLKQIAILGNLVVSLTLSLSVLAVGMFDIIPIMNRENFSENVIMLYILLDYAVFAFIINFIREVVKDMEDIKGDEELGITTLPVVIGIKKTKKIIFTISALAVITLLWYINKNLMNHSLYYATVYSLVFVVAPMLLFISKILSSKTKKEFHFLSTVLKWVILFGIISILVITTNIKYNG